MTGPLLSSPPRWRHRARARVAALAVVAVALAAPAASHDFWLEPTSWSPQPGALLGIRLRVGEHYVGDPVPRDPALLRRFAVVDGQGERPVPGAPGRDPAGLLRAASGAGTLLVVYESAPSPAAMDREKLAGYLVDEGLAELPGVAAAVGYPPGRPTTQDLFSRHVKALIVPAGDAAAASPAVTRPAGLAFELVPLVDPTRRPGGGAVGFRALRAGRPVAGIRVAAIPRRAPRAVVAARTDARGDATLELGPGEWLVKAVLAEPAPAGSGAELRSYWASITFQVPPAAPAAAAGGSR